MVRADDERLLADMLAGCEDAFLTFDRRFRRPLLVIARLRHLEPEDAEDLVQETLAAAVRQIRDGRFESRSSLKTWVHGIFHRRASDHFRNRVLEKQVMVPGDVTSDGQALVSPYPDGAFARATDPEVALAVREALAALPSKERAILILNLQHGFATREVATMFRLNKKTAEALLTRAKEHFRQRMRATEETPPARRLKV